MAAQDAHNPFPIAGGGRGYKSRVISHFSVPPPIFDIC